MRAPDLQGKDHATNCVTKDIRLQCGLLINEV